MLEISFCTQIWGQWVTQKRTPAYEQTNSMAAHFRPTHHIGYIRKIINFSGNIGPYSLTPLTASLKTVLSAPMKNLPSPPQILNIRGGGGGAPHNNVLK